MSFCISSICDKNINISAQQIHPSCRDSKDHKEDTEIRL